jgi:hypothetical protein
MRVIKSPALYRRNKLVELRRPGIVVNAPRYTTRVKA